MSPKGRSSIFSASRGSKGEASIIPRRGDAKATQGDTVLRRGHIEGDTEPLALKDQSLIFQ